MVIRRLSAALSTAALSCALSGCYEDNCELRGTCPVLDIGVADNLSSITCDETSDEVRDGCGVVAVSTGSDEDGNGTRYNALPHDREGAGGVGEGAPHRVCVRAEVFEEAVVMTGGYRVIGGLACEDDWTHSAPEKKTEVVAGPGRQALRVQPGEGVARLVDMRLRAADAVDPSGSSIAVLLEDGSRLSFERCHFVAGKGMAGLTARPRSPDCPSLRRGRTERRARTRASPRPRPGARSSRPSVTMG